MRFFRGKVTEWARCGNCGLMQLPEDGLRCRSCGAPLITPMRVYRRDWRGEWIPLDDLDLTSFLPLPPKRRRKRLPRKWVVLGLLACLPGVILAVWSWKFRANLIQQEHVAQQIYRNLGVGFVQVRLDASVRRLDNGRVNISGHSNLPDSTILEAQILHDDTLLARDFPILLKGGSFQSGELSKRGLAFRPGDYQLKLLARFDPAAQPQEVLNWAGPGGKKLRGSLVVPSPEDPRVKQVLLRQSIQLE